MGFGGEVEYRTRLVLGQQLGDEIGIADIAVDQAMARVIFQRGKIVGVAGVGQLVQRDDRLIALGEPVEHEIRTDKAGATGDNDTHYSLALERKARPESPLNNPPLCRKAPAETLLKSNECQQNIPFQLIGNAFLAPKCPCVSANYGDGERRGIR